MRKYILMCRRFGQMVPEVYFFQNTQQPSHWYYNHPNSIAKLCKHFGIVMHPEDFTWVQPVDEMPPIIHFE